VTVAWVRLVLDLTTFDARPFQPYVDRCRRAGIAVTTLAVLGDTEARRCALYELDRSCSADSPERGEFSTYEQYVDRRIDVPTFDPAGVVLALEEDRWVGFTTTSIHPEGSYAYSEMTGVLRSHRGRGLSLALKLPAVEHARAAGSRRLHTFHHPDNVAAIAMNRRLGFVDDVEE
jgi:GNAT superfamily N-acetyltransferase